MQIATKKIAFPRHVFIAGVHTTDEKVKAIPSFSTLGNLKTLQSFLDLFTKKDAPFDWNERGTRASIQTA